MFIRYDSGYTYSIFICLISDKAGGYGYQGLAALFIESIQGDYYNVVCHAFLSCDTLIYGYGYRSDFLLIDFSMKCNVYWTKVIYSYVYEDATDL